MNGVDYFINTLQNATLTSSVPLIDTIDSLISTVMGALWSYVLVAFIIFLALYFSFATKFIQIRRFGRFFTTLLQSREKIGSASSSSFHSFITALGARVGSGNIIGVSIAIYFGGPGAIFWMCAMAMLNMSTSLVESTLAQVYKDLPDAGNQEFKGGPAYYISKGIKQPWMAVLFSIFIATCLTAFNGLQASYISTYNVDILSIGKIASGLGVGILFGLVVFGGFNSISKVCEIIVPVMAITYLLCSFYVIITNITEMPAIFSLIFQSAFGIREFVAGTIAHTIKTAMVNGVKRGMYSNEVALGTMPAVAATSDVPHPAQEGFIQTLGVIIDTLIICSATAFIILTFDGFEEQLQSYDAKDAGGLLIRQAFAFHLGESWSGYFLVFSIFTFGFTSILGNYYIGETNVRYLHNISPLKNTFSAMSIVKIYQLIHLGIIIFFATMKIGYILNIADLFMGLAALINLIALFILRKEGIAVIRDYESQIKQGIKSPSFDSKKVLPHLETDIWKKS